LITERRGALFDVTVGIDVFHRLHLQRLDNGCRG
jgi:hypothetical protein